MHVRIYESIEDVAALRADWGALWAQTPQASFFQSFDWLQAYWRHFAADQELRIAAVVEDGVTTGIVPLVIRRERTRLGDVRFLTFPLDYWASFYGPIGIDPVAALNATLAHLSRGERDWDVLELRWAGATNDQSRQWEDALRAAKFSPVASLLDRTSVVDLTGTWDDYLAARGGKWRNNLKRWRRRLSEVGELRYERYRSPGDASDPRWDLFDSCIKIAQSSWQGSSQSGTTISHREIREFVKDAHQAAADCGCVDMNLLYVGDQPAAFAYNYHCRGHLFGFRVGYDPSQKSKGAGNLLYAMVIEDSFRRGDWRYDLGPDSVDAKRHLRTEMLPIMRLSCFRQSSLRQQLLQWKRKRDAQRAVPIVDASGQIDASAPVGG